MPDDEIDINAGFSNLPVADLQMQTGGQQDTNLTFDTFERTKAVEDIDIRKIEVRERTLLKLKSSIDKMTESVFPLSEILLSIATLSIGGIIGAIVSSLSTDETFGKVFYLITSIIAVGTSVSYFFSRYLEKEKPKFNQSELKIILTDIFGDEEKEHESE